MAIDSYTRDLIGLFNSELSLEPASFFRGFFREVTTDTEKLAYDVQRGDFTPAKDVYGNAENIQQLGDYTNKEYTPLEYRETTPINNRQLIFKRMPGDTEYTNRSQMEKLTEARMYAAMQSAKKINLALELRCIESLKGSISPDNGVSEDVSFHQKAAHKFDSTNAWDTTSGDPVSDLIQAGDLLKKNGRVEPSIIVCGVDALKGLYSNTDIKTQLDQRHRSDISKVYNRSKRSGVIFHGIITAGNYQFEVYSHNEFYDKDGTQTPYIDAGDVYVLPTNPDFILGFGGLPEYIGNRNTQSGIIQARLYPTWYVSENGRDAYVTVESRPLPIPVMIDQVVVINAS